MSDLKGFYRTIQEQGHLRTEGHAQRWSTAVLKSLSLNLDRKTKKKLAKALPDELAQSMMRVFWLAHFRDMGITQLEFQKLAASRAGNTDPDFARSPVTAVFRGLKALAGQKISDLVADNLAPALSQMWQDA